jgi:hypothetical protein
MAALDQALCEALAGLTSEQASELKLAFARVMGELVTEIINPTFSAYPELEPDQKTWNAVAKSRARARGNAV